MGCRSPRFGYRLGLHRRRKRPAITFFAVSSVNHREVKRKIATADFVLIDTPPGNSQVLDAVANRSDLLIIPTKPASLDMARVWVTLDSIPAALPAIVLLTHANPRTISYQQAIDALTEAQIAVFDTPIKSLETIKTMPILILRI